jgi:hypothetical protein
MIGCYIVTRMAQVLLTASAQGTGVGRITKMLAWVTVVVALLGMASLLEPSIRESVATMQQEAAGRAAGSIAPSTPESIPETIYEQICANGVETVVRLQSYLGKDGKSRPEIEAIARQGDKQKWHAEQAACAARQAR